MSAASKRPNAPPVETLDSTAIAARLREADERLRLVLRAGKIGLWDWDIVNDRVTWSDSLHAIHGVPREQFDGTVAGFAALVHPDDRGPVQRAIQSALEHDAPYELEFRMLRPGGGILWLFTNATVVRENNRPVRMAGASLDITARKTAELALRESEKRFRTLASHAPVGIFLTNPAGETIFVNEAWTRMAGVPSEQARGNDWANAMHPDDRERVLRGWDDARRRGASTSSAEYRFLRRDGAITWVQGNAVQLHDDRGQPAGYIGTIVDVTERKLAEDTLRTQEAQLRLISTNAPIMLTHCSRENRFLFVNRAYAERLGFEPEEMIGHPIAEILGEDACRVIQPYVDRVLRGETVSYEAEVPYPKLGRRFMRIAYAPDFAPDGSVQGWLAALSDITDEKTADDALRRLAAIVESSDDAILSKDVDGIITSWNGGAERIYGYPAEETVGQSIFMLIPPERAEEEQTMLDRIRRGERPARYDTIRRRKDGTQLDMAIALSPLKNAAGEVVGSSVIGRDITQQKRDAAALHLAQARLQTHADDLEQKIQERTASLREAVGQMEEFSYSVSHDLRAPLRAMTAYAEILMGDYGDRLDATARHYLTRIQRSSDRMEKLTHDLLRYSRVVRDEVHLAPIDLEALVDDVMSHYPELQSTRADVEICRPLQRVIGHESSLGQCLANLLTNAAKFVASGVRPKIRVRTTAAQERVRIWIEDNGIGIAPENQARLFRIFERVPSRHSYEGTGIGLAIVRKAVEKMGGACGVESDGKSGSRFWIELAKG